MLIGLLVAQVARPRPGVAMPDLGNERIVYPETATYNSAPPSSGPHYTLIAPWGIHDQPITYERQVHNLEEGGVLVRHECDHSCPSLVDDSASVVARHDGHLILAPYPDMGARIALTAWARLETLEAFVERSIVRFIEAHRRLDHHE